MTRSLTFRAIAVPFMSHSAKPSLTRKRFSFPVLLLLLLLWCAGVGWGLAGIGRSQDAPPRSTPADIFDVPSIGTVDPIPERYNAGQDIYLENCASCHIAVPPAVLPTETWRELLLDEEHYGVQVEVLPSPQIYILWDYLQTFSRPKASPDETIPYRLEYSTYFRALHPTTEVPRPVDIRECASCHPGAGEFDFRSLSASTAPSMMESP